MQFLLLLFPTIFLLLFFAFYIFNIEVRHGFCACRTVHRLKLQKGDILIIMCERLCAVATWSLHYIAAQFIVYFQFDVFFIFIFRSSINWRLLFYHFF